MTAGALADDGSVYWNDFHTTHHVQRVSQLTVNASPEPVKKGRTNSTGELKTTVTAATDGYFRYSFAGTSTTSAITTAGDFVDVQ